jgi:hypothetical protein
MSTPLRLVDPDESRRPSEMACRFLGVERASHLKI